MKNNWDVELQKAGLKSTPTRRALLALLAKSSQPLSVDDLAECLKKSPERRNFDVVTVYRTLKSFEKADLVNPVDLGLGKIFYELSSKHAHHHHHVICTVCHKIEHLEVCGLDLHVKILEGMGYRNLQHRLEFTGVCSRCKN